MDIITCKKCSRCKEILGLEDFPCNGRHSWCRMCAADSVRRYRKTERYRKAYAEYLSRPEVKEARRRYRRARPPRPRAKRNTPRNKLIAQQCQARYRARQYEIAGNNAAATRQWDRVAMLTQEIARIDKLQSTVAQNALPVGSQTSAQLGDSVGSQLADDVRGDVHGP